MSNNNNNDIEVTDYQQILNLKITEGQTLTGKNTLINTISNGLNTEHKFINSSTVPLYICFRNGTITKLLPHTTGPYMNALIISYRSMVYNGTTTTINGVEYGKTQAIKVDLITSGDKGFYNEEIIHMDAFKDSRYGVYVREADVVVTQHENVAKFITHPYSVHGEHNRLIYPDSNFDASKEVCVRIVFIDNEQLYSTIYVVINDTVMAIKPKRSNVLSDGIYISGLCTLDDNNNNTLRENVKCTYEDVVSGKSKLIFYTSVVEARDAILRSTNLPKELELIEANKSREHQTLISQIKREKEYIENMNIKFKLQQQEEQARNAEKIARLDAQLQAAREEVKHTHDINTLKVKGDHTVKVAESKEWVETLKVIGGALVLGGVVYKVLF